MRRPTKRRRISNQSPTSTPPSKPPPILPNQKPTTRPTTSNTATTPNFKTDTIPPRQTPTCNSNAICGESGWVGFLVVCFPSKTNANRTPSPQDKRQRVIATPHNRLFAENLIGLGFLLSVSHLKPMPTEPTKIYLLCEKKWPMCDFAPIFSWVGVGSSSVS